MSGGDLASLISAVKAGDLEAARGMLRARPELVRARPDEGPSVLLLAVYHGRREAAELLLGAGAPVDIFEAAALGLRERATALLDGEPGLANAWNIDGFQPLGLASFFGHPSTVRLLLERGAQVNSASRNPQRVMPLHSAVAARSPEIVRLLITHGADVDAAQQHGFTALHAAAHDGHQEIVALLLHAGATPGAPAEDGLTPRDLASRAGHERIARLLEAAGAVT